MTPIELLIKYPRMAMSLPQEVFRPQKQTDPRLQQAMDMAMQMSTPLVVGRTMPQSAVIDHVIAGRILNRSEQLHTSAPTTSMNLLGLARRFLKEPARAAGITQKQIGKLTQSELFDAIGKIIRSRNK